MESKGAHLITQRFLDYHEHCQIISSDYFQGFLDHRNWIPQGLFDFKNSTFNPRRTLTTIQSPTKKRFGAEFIDKVVFVSPSSISVFAARLPVCARFGYFLTKQNCLDGSFVAVAKILFCASYFLQVDLLPHLLTGLCQNLILNKLILFLLLDHSY